MFALQTCGQSQGKPTLFFLNRKLDGYIVYKGALQGGWGLVGHPSDQWKDGGFSLGTSRSWTLRHLTYKSLRVMAW